jgi:hypothetical protein
MSLPQSNLELAQKQLGMQQRATKMTAVSGYRRAEKRKLICFQVFKLQVLSESGREVTDLRLLTLRAQLPR